MPGPGGAFEQVGVQAVVKGFNPYMSKLGSMDSKTKGFGGTLGKLGKTAAAMGAGFIAAQVSMVGVQQIMSRSIGAAVAYQAQMAEIRALTGATEKDTDFLTVAIKDMTRAMPKSPQELGAAAYFILSSGIEDAADAAEVLDVAARASTIGLGETASVADALTTVLNAYGKSADEAGQVTDVMIEAVKQGKAEADAFAGVLGRVVPLAAQMGISFEEVAANLATFTRLGVSADLAATGLRQVMASLLKPTEDQVEAMEELGFSAEGLRQQIKDKGLLVTLDAMMKATGGNEAAVARLFPNIRALTSVLGTVGVQMEDYTDILAATNNASGNLEEGFGIVADTAKFKMGVAMNEINLMLMELGEEILPALVPAMKVVVFTVERLAEALKLLKIHPLVLLVGALGDAFGKLPTPIEAAKERLQEMAASAEITKDEFIDLAQQIGMSEGAAQRLADNTAFPTAVEVWRKEAERFGMSTEEFNRRLAETTPWIEGASDAIIAFHVQERKAEAASLAAASATGVLTNAVAQLKKELGGITQAMQDVTGQRTQEANALDIQINAMKLEQNAALQSEIGQEKLGDSVKSTTDALSRQVGALNNLAASMVPQALNNEIIALDRELKVLELGKAAIEAQISARNRLAQAQLAMARIANLPAMLELKKLELKREQLLAAQSAKTLKLEKEKAKLLAKADPSDADKERIKVIDALLAVQKAAIKQIDDEMEALSRGIHIKTLEAEITNLQAEASDKNSEAMQKELNKITDQIGATTDLKRERELYIDTLIPLELLQEIDALGRQKTALDNSKTGAEGATGATRTLSDTIGDQITKLDLQREAIDLVTQGWELQAKAMLGLPKMEDLRKHLLGLKAQMLLLAQAAIIAALGRLDIAGAAKLGQLMGQIAAFQPAQHGFHGMVTGPQGFFIEPGRTERVDITPQAQPVLAPSVAPQAAATAGGGVDPSALAGAVAGALQGMTVVMDGRIVGSLVNDRIGDRTFQLGRGG